MKYVQLIITLTLFGILYFPVFPAMAREWMTAQDYSHGFLIPFISLYFLWHKRSELRNTTISPSSAGLLFIFAGLLVYTASRIGYQFFMQCVSMLIVIFGIVYAQAGREMAKKAAFAISYLIFMIPLPDLAYTTITFHLRLLSTKMAFFIIKLLGINATREGNIIHLPTCTMLVANPCSGLRGLIVFMAASLAIGYIFQTEIKKRVILFLSAIGLAILMNTLRLVITGVVSDMLELSEISASIHDTAGYVMLIAGFAALFGINDLLKGRK